MCIYAPCRMQQDSVLIKKIRDLADVKSFELLYDRYSPSLFAFAFQYCKSKTVSEDIVQDTFAKLWMRREYLDEKQPVKSYLFTISYHQILKELRRLAKNPLLRDYLECMYDSKSDSTSYDFDVFMRAVEEGKKCLTPRQKEIFIMNKELELSVSEIAQRLGIQAQVVSNQLCAAMKIIKSKFLML